MDTIAIAGVGLIGGSFALAIRRAGFAGRILGVSSPATIREALARHVVDEGVSLEEACSRADVLYLAQPIRTIIDLMPRVAASLRPGALVTDAGSTKREIVEAARRHLPSGVFLGGHPMAGKEVRGVQASDATLFEGRPYVLTPEYPRDLDEPRAAEFVRWVLAIGARPVVIDAAEHDSIVSYTSHLPQILSTVLAATLADLDRAGEIAGPSVIDLTRLAFSPIEVWNDIFATNAVDISKALDSFIRNLNDIKDNLTSDRTRTLFSRARDGAQKIRENR